MSGQIEQGNSHRGVALAAWIMMGTTCLVALIPGIGFLTWLVGGPVMLICLILGIIVISKGGTFQGIVILLLSFIILPAFLFLAPLIMTGLTAAGLEAADHEKVLQNPEAVEKEESKQIEEKDTSNR